MKHLILKIAWRLVIPMAALMFIHVSCDEKKDEKPVIPHDPNQQILVTSFQPSSGRVREQVLIDGSNFGTDISAIKVFFNSSEAKVIGSNGSRILALVPRLPGDTCTVSVEIGDKKTSGTGEFIYKIGASVTTLTGNGETAHDFAHGQLDKARLDPVYIGVDLNFNVFVTETDENLLILNEKENSIRVLMNRDQGFTHRCQPYVNPKTNVIQLGHESQRERYTFLDPKDGWAPRAMFIKEWDANGYNLPNDARHYFCLLCLDDMHYYTRYHDGQIVRIDPMTWKAKIVGMTPSGIAYGGSFSTLNPKELWLGYDGGTGNVAHSICKVNVTDETKWESVNTGTNPLGTNLLASFTKMSGAISGDHRDGPLEQAQFKAPRQISFDDIGNLFVGDNDNHCIRQVDTKSSMVSTVIGIPKVAGDKDGNRDEATFRNIHGIVTDAEGIIYASDYGNKKVRRIAIE